MKDWLARVVLGVILDRIKKWIGDWLETRAQVELQRRANEQQNRQNAPLGDDDVDKRLRDGSA
jgi:hypothetical protein